MGRYAFFDTGFEYKFVFAFQNSGDILEFGGWFNNNMQDPVVKWSAAESARDILEKLRDMETKCGWPAVDFAAYSMDLDGTHELRDEINWRNDELHTRYRLGCFIYHQLLYQPELSCRFEF